MSRLNEVAKRPLALLLATLTIGTGLLVVTPNVRAPLTFASPVLTPGLYTGTNVYVPMEEMTFTIYSTTVPPQGGDIFDVTVIVGGTPSFWYNDLVIPQNGILATVYQIPSTLPDGTYELQIGDINFMRDYPVGYIRSRFFNVQEYELQIEVDRRAYIGGDTITITWSAHRLQDGVPAADGLGRLWVYQNTFPRTYFQILATDTFTTPTGTRTVNLPATADADYHGFVEGYFNSSSGTFRSQWDQTDFLVERLSAIVDVDPFGSPPNIYAPDGIVTTRVTTVATDFQSSPFPWNPREPGITVLITVWDVTGGVGNEVLHSGYGASNLVTDAQGEITHIFRLQGEADQSMWEVRANVSHPTAPWTWLAEDSFSIADVSGMSARIESAQPQYQAGDVALATAVVSGSTSSTLTYLFEVRDATQSGCPGGTILGTRTVTSSRTAESYSYPIDDNFQGLLCFLVTVLDGMGNQAFDFVPVSVVFGWLVINANPDAYRPNDQITFTWELRSNRLSGPLYFYELFDQSGLVLRSGQGSSFVYPVGSTPSPWYMVRVTATDDGRSVVGILFVYEIQGFVLDIVLDRTVYARGDTIKFHYRIVPLGGSPMPPTFTFDFGIEHLPGMEVPSTHSEGDLQYVIPSNANEGDQEFVVFEGSTGAGASEVVTITAPGALSFGPVGPIDIVLLILVILLFLMLWRTGVFGGMRAPRAPKAPKEPATPPPPSRSDPVYAPASSPMTVTCRSCGSPIDITTSKRPIEVMCPRCGSTEMVS